MSETHLVPITADDRLMLNVLAEIEDEYGNPWLHPDEQELCRRLASASEGSRQERCARSGFARGEVGERPCPGCPDCQPVSQPPEGEAKTCKRCGRNAHCLYAGDICPDCFFEHTGPTWPTTIHRVWDDEDGTVCEAEFASERARTEEWRRSSALWTERYYDEALPKLRAAEAESARLRERVEEAEDLIRIFIEKYEQRNEWPFVFADAREFLSTPESGEGE